MIPGIIVMVVNSNCFKFYATIDVLTILDPLILKVFKINCKAEINGVLLIKLDQIVENGLLCRVNGF